MLYAAGKDATEQPGSLIKINTQRTNVDTPEMLINEKNVGGDGSDDKTKLWIVKNGYEEWPKMLCNHCESWEVYLFQCEPGFGCAK